MAGFANTHLAHVDVLNYELIKNKDPPELQKLLNASLPPPGGLGVFFLDLTGPSTSDVFEDLDKIYDSAGRFFKQSKEENLLAYREGLERG